MSSRESREDAAARFSSPLHPTRSLARIVEAHGGLARWRRFNRAEATIVTGGAFWGMKNLTQDRDPRRMTVSLHEQRASVAPFGDPDWHTEFTPDRIAILRGDGRNKAGHAGALTWTEQPGICSIAQNTRSVSGCWTPKRLSLEAICPRW